MKRVKLAHGSARVSIDAKEETLKALNELSILAHGVDFGEGESKTAYQMICNTCKRPFSTTNVKDSNCGICSAKYNL